MHRRDLFKGAGLSRKGRPARGNGELFRGSLTDLLRASRALMGSYFEIQLPVATPAALDLAERALDRIEALERQMTIYRDDSELSRLNATAHLGPTPVEPGLFALLSQAVAIGRETAGAYDVTAGALSLAWGFIRGPRRVPEPDVLAEARQRTGIQHLRLDPASGTIAFDCPGIVLNLGSIGKGHAVDQAASIIRDHFWPTPALVHGGQSSLYALGTPQNRLVGGWPISLRNPFNAECPLGTLFLRNRALGTSGAAFQHFEAGGRTYSHILDPRTGEPATGGSASVTVLAPTAALADALSTAFFLLGPEESAKYAARHPGVAAVFVNEVGQNYAEPKPEPDVLTIGVRDPDFAPDPLVPVRAIDTAQ
jgi:thiamine biosynthesis lipoprotein